MDSYTNFTDEELLRRVRVMPTTVLESELAARLERALDEIVRMERGHADDARGPCEDGSQEVLEGT